MQELQRLTEHARHAILVCGAAVSGSEAAALCAARGVLAIVIDQNQRPYGKVEDGLPRWHAKLRRQEYEKIDANLGRRDVLFVPGTALGRDVAFEQVARTFGLSAVLLANGAWRDRPLEVPGVEACVDRGFVYQNPFVHRFNLPSGDLESLTSADVPDGAIVVGGGLASIDVAKILNLQITARALAARGIAVSAEELEHTGIPVALARHGLSFDALGLRGCTLYYRRSKGEMPLATPRDDSPAERIRIARVREKLMDNVMRRYLVRFEGNHVPVAALTEGDRLVGLRFRRTETIDGRLREITGSEIDARAPLTVSSIGSVPTALQGVPRKGELYDFANFETGELRGLPGVFGLGNVLTGKGNIKDSRQNAVDVTARVLETLTARPPLSPAQLAPVLSWVRERWEKTAYPGDYAAWMQRLSPPGIR